MELTDAVVQKLRNLSIRVFFTKNLSCHVLVIPRHVHTSKLFCSPKGDVISALNSSAPKAVSHLQNSKKTSKIFRLMSNFPAKKLINLVHKISDYCLRFLLVVNGGSESLSSTVVMKTFLRFY